MGKKITDDEAFAFLSQLEPTIVIDRSTYSGWSNKATFTDILYGKWNQTPKRVFLEGCRHPKRAAENRANTNVEKYGVANPFSAQSIKDKIKITNKELYGVECAAQNSDIKNKIKNTNIIRYGGPAPACSDVIMDKIRNTNIDKYGVSTVLVLTDNQEKSAIARGSEEVKQKAKETNIAKYGNVCTLHGANHQRTVDSIRDKYGVENPMYSEEIKQRLTDTMMSHYGVSHYSKTDEFKVKFRATCQERFGVDHIFQLESSKKASIEARVNQGSLHLLDNGETLLEWHSKSDTGIGYTTLAAYVAKNRVYSVAELSQYASNVKKSFTSIEQVLSKSLSINKYGKKPHYDLNFRPDFKISDDLFINVDGLYWHSDTVQKDNEYHFNMRKSFEQCGYKLLQFREDELRLKLPVIISMINSRQHLIENKLQARKCTIVVVSNTDARSFLKENHLMGHLDAKHLGLYFEGKLVSLLSFKTKTKENIKTMMIERFCNKINTSVAGAFSKLLIAAEKEVMPTIVYSWVDLRYADGHSLEQCGFNILREIKGWCWTDYVDTYHRLFCRANMDERMLSQKEHAEEMGLHKIYDAGQRLYVRKRT